MQLAARAPAVRLRWLVIVAGIVGCVAELQAVEPQLDYVLPRGGQRGTKQVVTLQGLRLTDPVGLIFLDSGLSLEKFEQVDAQHLKATLVIAPDCPLGQHAFRLHTHEGVSEVRSFHVGPFPNAYEAEPNDTIKEAQPAALDTSIEGVLQERDRDFYRLKLEGGKRFTVELEGLRLGTVANSYINPLIDGVLKLYAPDGKLIAEADDGSITLRDPVISLIAPQSGEYLLEVYDAVLAGGDFEDYRAYRLHLGSYVRPVTAFPGGGKVGETLNVRWLDSAGVAVEETLTFPKEKRDDGVWNLFPGAAAGQVPTGNVLRLNDFDSANEQEPNDTAETAAEARAMPIAFNGIIQTPGDVDYFRFKLPHDGVWNIRVYAKKIGSPLDTIATVYRADGGRLVQADDSAFMDDMDGDSTDSFIRFSADKGEYILRVTGRLGEGGPAHVYRAEVIEAEAWLAAYVREYSQFSQKRLAIAVPRGNRFLMMIGYRRGNFAAELTSVLGQMPPGVRAEIDTVHSAVDAIPLWVEAAPDAPLTSRTVDFNTHVTKRSECTGQFHQVVELSVGMPAYTPYSTYLEKQLAVAVIDEVPFRVELTQPKVPLVRNGEMNLKVEVIRKPGFKENVNIQLPFKPPGVGVSPSITIQGGDSIGYYPMSASESAELGRWKLGVLGLAKAADGGEMCIASNLINVETSEHYIDAELSMAATKRGAPVPVVCKLSVLKSFDGEAKLELKGLPSGATAAPVMINAEANTATFQVQTTSECVLGKFNQLMCEATVYRDGEPIVQKVGLGGVLRVDPPTTSPDDPPPVEASGLSRRELLRKQYSAWLERQRR